ncbi:MAG: hypothetical protein R3345_15495, partial [Fulvivirga sp.]|nr:hypothetical protein [Fulvivirga sp.]
MEIARRVFNDISFWTVVLVILFHFFEYLIEGLQTGILSYDTFGYYLYLPQAFIADDIAISNLDYLNSVAIYKPSEVYYQIHALDNGNHVIQYSMGMAIVFLPFFLVGHLFASTGGYPMDGMSLPYVYAIIAGAYFYLVLGLVIFRKMLLLLFSKELTAVLLILIYLGTNFWSITTLSLGMPHLYLFALYALFLYGTIKWHKKPSVKYSLLIGFVFGLMILIRPVEIIACVIPILWGCKHFSDVKHKWIKIWYDRRKLLIAVLIPILFLGSLQMTYWKIVTGSFFFNSYMNNGEGFDFLQPHIIEFLFSFRKGWLIYTPLAILFLLGLFYMRPKERNKYFFPLFTFTVLYLYIIASWSNWWYGTSFSQRPVTQAYPV